MTEQESAIDEIVSAFVNLHFHLVKDIIKKALKSQIPPEDILKGMQEGMAAIGSRYEEGEYFLSELLAGAEMMKTGLEELTPHLPVASLGSAGIVVIGTVRGDIHDIGKNIVTTLLRLSGFNVYDLGTDVSPDAFINKVRDVNADILALSALLTTTMRETEVVIRELERAGLKNKVKVIIGGNSVTEEFGREIYADGATKDAVAGVRICQGWMNG